MYYFSTFMIYFWGCVISPKSQKNRFVNWPYGLQEAIPNREGDFLHSSSWGTTELVGRWQNTARCVQARSVAPESGPQGEPG